MEKIGFIGLGVMGKAMAKHILDKGFKLFIYNRTQSKADDLVAAGAVWCDSPSELAEKADIILTIVGYPQDVEEVYTGKSGLFEGVRPGQILIDLTTSKPALARQLFEKGQDLGVEVIDAPVSGGDRGAREGILTVMAGGTKEALDKVSPVLEAFSSNIIYHGPSGSGQHAKAANQIMIAGTMTGMTETLRYAKEAGLDLERVISTLTGGAANNWSLANYGPRILKGDYEPGFFVKHYIKDLGIALEEAEELGLDLPGTELAADLYHDLAEQGFEDDGNHALIKLWWPSED